MEYQLFDGEVVMGLHLSRSDDGELFQLQVNGSTSLVDIHIAIHQAIVLSSLNILIDARHALFAADAAEIATFEDFLLNSLLPQLKACHGRIVWLAHPIDDIAEPSRQLVFQVLNDIAQGTDRLNVVSSIEDALELFSSKKPVAKRTLEKSHAVTRSLADRLVAVA